MTRVQTRQQAREERRRNRVEFKRAVKRISRIKIEQTNNLTQQQQNHIVYRPQLCIMEEKLVKTVLANTIDKFPKFGGKNNENVNKWLTDITNELKLLKITDNQKLSIVQTFLLDDARQWYINNLSTITDWSTFIIQIQKTFSSTLHQKLAIKQVGNREQGLEESVLHYYNDMMQLFDTMDVAMTDPLKVAYLRTGLKVSLQREVMRKDPKTPIQFLEMAQAEEKLEASMNIQIDNSSASNMESFSAIKSLTKSYLPPQQNLQQKHRGQSFKQIRCYNCNKIGHIARNCFSKNY